MSINERYIDHTNALARAGLSMKIFLLLRNCGKCRRWGEKEKKENVKIIEEGDIMLISALVSHNCGGRKFIV